MKSKTKKDLTQQEIRKICISCFGKSAELTDYESLNDGMYNSSYKINVSVNNSSETYVIKVAPPPQTEVLTYEKDIMKTELFISTVLNEKTKVPVPKIIHYNFNRDIIERDFIISSYLNGIPLNKIKMKLNKSQKDTIKHQIGKYMAQIHTLSGDYYGYIADSSSLKGSTWYEAFFKMFKAILDDGRKKEVDLSIPYESLIEAMKSKKTVLDEVKEPTLVHFDMWDGNIFIIGSENRYEVEGIIDCERAFYGDPLCDLICSVNIFGDILKEEAFLKGLMEDADKDIVFTRSQKTRLHLYRLYLFSIMLIEIPYRGRGGWLYKSLIKNRLKAVYKKLLETD